MEDPHLDLVEDLLLNGLIIRFFHSLRLYAQRYGGINPLFINGEFQEMHVHNTAAYIWWSFWLRDSGANIRIALSKFNNN